MNGRNGSGVRTRLRARGSGRWVCLVLLGAFGMGLLFSGCAATGGAAGALLGYGITGNARGAALGAGAGVLAGSLYDAGVVRPAYPYGYAPGPQYYSTPGRWVYVPGYYDPYGHWVHPYRYWAPY
jgi:hypothetical protein